MASRSELTQAIHDELVAVMDARSDTDAGNAHVVLNDEDLPDTPPALSVFYMETPNPDGSAHDTRVKELVTNASDEVVDVRYADDKEFTAEVTCLAQTDQTAVSVYEDVRQHFNAYDRITDPEDLAAGVDDVSCEDSSPQDGDDRRGHLLRITVEYEDTFLYSDVTGSQLTPARSVEQTIEAMDSTDSQSNTTQ